MYRRERGNEMKRIYDVPPSYSGSRFIRATHGVRALSDGELSPPQSVKERPRVPANAGGAGVRNTPRPDFEYYGNAISPSDKPERERQYPPDEAKRGDPSPADRSERGFDRGFGKLLPPQDRPPAALPVPDADPTAPDGAESGFAPNDGAPATHGESTARLISPGRLGSRPHRARFGGAFAGRASVMRRGAGGGVLDLSADDGDLLLLALLALLAGESDCADVAAALALLLAVR